MNDDREVRIRQRAYELWETAGQPEGCEQEHWYLAEASVAAEEEPAAPAPKPRARKAKVEAEDAAPARTKAAAAPKKPRRSKSAENAA
ncbi:DUF2934 domain-containing protein [Rhodobacter sp. CZR27]|uniref:DUF2934 domain-containing protein n=1 Tax=Rhodobacter sp. CZR27 TaxID=2033869 RepID=UPI000BBE6487|nr:DUF2934 domain-containing protein [Rhodobacter sp. CZR27]